MGVWDFKWGLKINRLYSNTMGKRAAGRTALFPSFFIKKLSTISTGSILQFSPFFNISPPYIHFVHIEYFVFYPYILQFLPVFFWQTPLNAGQAPIYPQSYPHYPQFPTTTLTHSISPGYPQFYPQSCYFFIRKYVRLNSTP